MPVYQEKNKKKWTKDGRSWYFRCYYTDIYGNNKQKESRMFFSKSEAKDAERDFLNKVKTTEEIDYDISFVDVYKEWCLYKKRKVKETVFYSMKLSTDKHILKFFGKHKLHNIKMNYINLWFDYIDDSALSLKTKNTQIGYLRDILNYAKDNYDFDSKIVNKIIPYKGSSSQKKTKNSEWNFWTYDDFNKFIACVDNQLYSTIFNLLYFTGLRVGEMIALTWEDINLDKKYIKIRKNFTNKLGIGTFKIIDPKTINSIREIDLDDELVVLLKKWKDMQTNIIGFDESWFVFGNLKPISPTTISRYLKKYIEISQVKYITIHGFRHSHVSLLIDVGCDVRDVAKRIGDTVEVVESTYYHMFPKKKTELINRLNELKK